MQQKPVIFLAFANEMESASRYLRGLAKEKSLIREKLERASEAGLCEVVVESNATVNSILNTFQKPRYRDRIAIFHYGGHADGYQLLLESLEGSNVVAHGEGLVSFFGRQKGLQLIFLNGCSTQEQAMDLVKAGIPAVIGTSHVVSDDVATQLAGRFYQGMANGATIQRSWKEAEDEMLILKGKGNTRSLYFGDKQKSEEAEVPEFFPWDLYIREGAEIVKDWNLPEAVDNPLFGLPEPPLKHLPERPYRFLERYTESHSEIFFGRSYYIRDLYDRVSNPSSAPVVLLYGQSGVGKSSLLDAGLFPRLEQSCEVVYVRREVQKGLLGSLRAALGSYGVWEEDEELAEQKRQYKDLARKQRDYQNKLEQIEHISQGLDEHSQAQLQSVLEQLRQNAPAEPMPESLAEAEYVGEAEEAGALTLLEAWQQIEAQSEKPLVIILDQAEEAFSQPNPNLPSEWQDFLREVKELFLDPKNMPIGKLMLAYRKEYHPEIEEFFKTLHIPREQVFLKQLTKKDLREVITGLTRTQRLENQYRLTVDEELSDIIADDLLEDRDSPIAPVLQILLTKMWHQVEAEQFRYFTVEQYQSLRKEGILMGDFLDQQMEELERQHPDWVQSGWVLDLLYFHTTSLGTAGSRSREQIQQRYADKGEALPALMEACRSLYLLAGGENGGSVLAHDTLAPLVQERFRTSDLPGQRAARLMEHKVPEYHADPANTLDTTDLAIVEAGQHGMKMWGEEEIALVEASRRRRKRAQALRRNLLILGAIGALMVLGFGIFARIEGQKARERAIALADTTKAARKARDEAVSARIEADNERINANRQRDRADSAKREALIVADQLTESQANLLNKQVQLRKTIDSLDTQKKITQESLDRALESDSLAQIESKRANEENARAQRSLYLSAAKALATKSLVAEDSLKIPLVAQAKHFYDSMNGPEFDPDLYQAMYQALKNKAGSDDFQVFQDSTAPVHAVQGIAWLNNREFLSTGAEGTLRKWAWQEPHSSQKIDQLKDGLPRSLATNSEGEIFLVSTQRSLRGKIPDMSQAIPLQQFDLHNGKTLDVISLGPDRGFLSTGEDRKLIWSNMNKDTVHVATAPTKIHALAIHPEKQYILGAGEDGNLWIWDQENGYERSFLDIAEISGNHPLYAVEVSPDGRYVFVGDEHGHLRGLDWAGGFQFFDFPAHKGRITALAFHPNGKQLASASLNRTVKLWNMDRLSDLPIQLTDHEDWVMSIAYSPDGTRLLAGLNNGQIKYWPTRADFMSRALFDQLEEGLTRDEWTQFLGDDIPYSTRVKTNLK